MVSFQDQDLKDKLTKCKDEHTKLDSEIQAELDKYHYEGKEPAVMEKGMSWIKTNVMLAMDKNDQTIADLITDGCNMGVKSLNKYLNQYEAADEQAKNIAKDLIRIEDDLVKEIRCYL